MYGILPTELEELIFKCMVHIICFIFNFSFLFFYFCFSMYPYSFFFLIFLFPSSSSSPSPTATKLSRMVVNPNVSRMQHQVCKTFSKSNRIIKSKIQNARSISDLDDNAHLRTQVLWRWPSCQSLIFHRLWILSLQKTMLYYKTKPKATK